MRVKGKGLVLEVHDLTQGQIDEIAMEIQSATTVLMNVALDALSKLRPVKEEQLGE